jgi:hypothetical protein
MSMQRDLLITFTLSAAIIIVSLALFSRSARPDGLLPPPAIVYAPPYTLPYVQGPPTQSCLMTAIQLGYQTGNRYVANAAAAACRAYAPVAFPRRLWAHPIAPPGPPMPPSGVEP